MDTNNGWFKNNIMIENILKITNDILDSIDLSEYQKRRNSNGLPEHWFFMKSGKEHYRLLCHISSLYDDVTFIDIGTWVGSSALGLGYNKNNKVISFDIIRQQRDTQGIMVNVDGIITDENIKFEIGNVLEYNKEVILNSPFMMLDTKHDGVFEQEFFDFLVKENYNGIVLFDDIHLNSQMKNFWSNIELEKYDITNIGHWSGTGVVVFK